MDDEIKGKGNSVNYKYRMHDPRIGRFFAIDPLAPKYPHNSPYAFSENRVIDGWELEGLEVEVMNSSGDVIESGPLAIYADTDVESIYGVGATAGPTGADASFFYGSKISRETYGPLESQEAYDNAIYGIQEIAEILVAPSAAQQKRDGFFMGVQDWAINKALPAGQTYSSIDNKVHKDPPLTFKELAFGAVNTVTGGMITDVKSKLYAAHGNSFMSGYVYGNEIIDAKLGQISLLSGIRGGSTRFRPKNYVTLYRGINSTGGVGYKNGLSGVAKPRGGYFGHTDRMLHNSGVDGTLNSRFTSWTTNKEVALNAAYRRNGRGVLLTKTVPFSSTYKSPDTKSVNLIQSPGTIVSESEVLMKGTVRGASSEKVNL